ncbi:hypothetical protein [Mycolicibacterium cosmeticum]|uniref:hypothetical protein n=1 Tax=Mycolicibacterium cosmeticum TaxID=258533 RepID=UPI003204E8B8
MESLLLSVHVLAGILFVGPIAVSTSLFPRFAPVAGEAGHGNADIAAMLYRITRVYGTLALVVPLVGVLLAMAQGRATEIWIIVAMVLTAAAGGLLALQIVPRQREALDAPRAATALRRLGMLAGIFNLLWAIVVILMVVRPGAHLG